MAQSRFKRKMELKSKLKTAIYCTQKWQIMYLIENEIIGLEIWDMGLPIYVLINNMGFANYVKGNEEFVQRICEKLKYNIIPFNDYIGFVYMEKAKKRRFKNGR